MELAARSEEINRKLDKLLLKVDMLVVLIDNYSRRDRQDLLDLEKRLAEKIDEHRTRA
jgi:hypothetical protein